MGQLMVLVLIFSRLDLIHSHCLIANSMLGSLGAYATKLSSFLMGLYVRMDSLWLLLLHKCFTAIWLWKGFPRDANWLDNVSMCWHVLSCLVQAPLSFLSHLVWHCLLRQKRHGRKLNSQSKILFSLHITMTGLALTHLEATILFCFSSSG